MTEPPPEMPPPGNPYIPPAPYSPAPGQPYYHPTYGWVTPPSTTNGLAIASLVLSLLWLAGIGSVLGVIFGHVSRGQIKRQPEKGNGLALAGLIIGYIGIAGAIAIGVGVAVFATNSGVRNAIVRDDVRNVAAAEELNLIDHGTYTNSSTDLDAERFNGPSALFRETLLVAFNGHVGYCVVGSRNGVDDWYLYDSTAGGMTDFRYSTEADAEAACTVPGLSAYESVD